MPHPNGMPTFDELRNMPDAELYESIDKQFSLTPNERHLMLAQLYRDELLRREQDKSTQSMLDYTDKIFQFTAQIRNMTTVILVATVLGVAVSIWATICNLIG